MPHNVRLRPARASDRAFAERLYLGTMLPLLTALGHGDLTALKARFARGFSRRYSRIIGSAGSDAGWIQVTPTKTGCHLDQLHLVEGWRGRGIGRVLIGRLLARAAAANTEVGLDVIYGNPAEALYRRLGFKIVSADQEKHAMVWRPIAKPHTIAS